MRTTIDKAGRLVVPKVLRDRLRLEPGTELEIDVVDDRLEISAPRPVATIVEGPGGRPVISAPGAVLTVDEVREWRMRTQDPHDRGVDG